MSESLTHGFMSGIFCPACGDDNLRRMTNGVLKCTFPGCSDVDAAQKVLSDPEIHHIVRFNPDFTFNVQHPLRERVGSMLLDCLVHTEVQRSHAEGAPTEGTWRLKKASDDNLDANWVWERL